MSRRVSPLFAILVIAVAVALGALYFAMRYRAHEAEEAALARMLQAQADRARRSGRPQRAMSRVLRGRAESPSGQQTGAVPGGSGAEERTEQPKSADEPSSD
jgi:cytochrome c-type biogenesis protein CcmH/NrfG